MRLWHFWPGASKKKGAVKLSLAFYRGSAQSPACLFVKVNHILHGLQLLGLRVQASQTTARNPAETLNPRSPSARTPSKPPTSTRV